MSINIIDKLKHASGGAVADAADIVLENGVDLEAAAMAAAEQMAQLREDLDGLDVTPPVAAGAEVLEPEIYYQFGEVSELAVELAQKEDGKAHLYQFEFVPAEDFAGLTITPEPVWCNEPQYPVGKRVLVAVQMGMAVMGIA